MPKQSKRGKQQQQWSSSSRCASLPNPDDAWEHNQMMDTMDDSMAWGVSSVERAEAKQLESRIFNTSALRWIKQAYELDSASRQGRPKVVKVDWEALKIKEAR